MNEQNERLHPRLHGFAAGIIAGAAGVCVGHPFDTLKVSMQVSSSNAPPNPFHKLKTQSLLQKTVHLYRGVFPPLVSTGIVQSLNFGVYENTRNYLSQDTTTDNNRPPMWTVTTAAFISGAATSPLTAVVTKFKLLQQVKGSSMRTIIGDIRNLHPFRFFHVHLLLESFGRAVYLTTYIASKRLVDHFGYNNNDFFWRVTCGATSGVVAWTSIYPMDVLRSRLFSNTNEGVSIQETFSVMKKEGALFRGLGFTLVRAAPVAGVVLTCYDVVLDWIRGA